MRVKKPLFYNKEYHGTGLRYARENRPAYSTTYGPGGVFSRTLRLTAAVRYRV